MAFVKKLRENTANGEKHGKHGFRVIVRVGFEGGEAGELPGHWLASSPPLCFEKASQGGKPNFPVS
jgi:hypothetical protein